MKKMTGMLLLCCLFVAVKAQKKADTAFIAAKFNTDGKFQKFVSISWPEIQAKHPALKPGNFRVLEQQSGKEIPYQLEYAGSATPKNLLVNMVFEPNVAYRIILVQGKPAEFPWKTYGRYVPERKDDFAWENDKIAFRMYGKALEGTSENAFGMDVWAKRTDQLIIDKWYKSGDYHADHGDGLDYYSVGSSLGAGDIAPYVDGNIVFPKNYRRWKILDQGPFRFTFQLEYDGWDVAGKTVSMVKKISLDAGSQLNKIETTFDYGNDTASLPVVIGIVKRKERGTVFMNEKLGIMSYVEPEHGKDGILSIGVILDARVNQMLVTDSHLLTLFKTKSKRPIVYYSGAVWSKANSGIKDWNRHLAFYHLMQAAENSMLNINIK